jgi:hypothetical protein
MCNAAYVFITAISVVCYLVMTAADTEDILFSTIGGKRVNETHFAEQEK